jgi:hypothetical protein
VKILLRCAGRDCVESLYVAMDQGEIGAAVATASWIFVRSSLVPGALQPVCWACASRLELSPQDLERVRRFHAMATGQKGASS